MTISTCKWKHTPPSREQTLVLLQVIWGDLCCFSSGSSSARTQHETYQAPRILCLVTSPSRRGLPHTIWFKGFDSQEAGGKLVYVATIEDFDTADFCPLLHFSSHSHSVSAERPPLHTKASTARCSSRHCRKLIHPVMTDGYSKAKLHTAHIDASMTCLQRLPAEIPGPLQVNSRFTR